MTLPKPYWTDGERTLYHADFRDVLGALGAYVLLTDPPNEFAGAHWWHDVKVRDKHVLVNVATVPVWLQCFPDFVGSTVWVRPMPTATGVAWDLMLHAGLNLDREPILDLVEDDEPRVTLHPAERGEKAWTTILHNYAHNGLTVLDPFAGSGTTLAAARLLGMEAIGVEVSEEFCEMAVRRLTS